MPARGLIVLAIDSSAGGRPKGVLLVGAPGTGKTLHEPEPAFLSAPRRQAFAPARSADCGDDAPECKR
jgi:MoxR-like ATPase